MPEKEKTLTELLTENRKEADEIGTKINAIIVAAEADQKRSLTEDESTEFDKLTARAEQLDKQESALQLQEMRAENTLRRAEALKAATRQYGDLGRVVSEPSVYTPHSAANHGASYFRDLGAARKGDSEAIARLRSNDKHVETYRVRDTGLSTGNGAGGEFVPPLWLENDYVPLARAGRVTADLCTKDALPTGTDSINIPKVNTGTAVATQGTPTGGQNTAILNTDLTTTSISSGVFTAAGGQTVSMQLIEQSPVNIDKVVLTDLALANAINTDVWVLNGAGGSGAPQGILGLTGTNAITYTDATPSLVGTTGTSAAKNMYQAVAQGISKIQRTRFLPPTHIVMHPETWYWILTQSDTAGRPVVLENQYGLFNAVGAQEGLASQGVVGGMLGLPIVADPNVPLVNTTQLPIIIGRFDDAWLWEGALKAEAFEQTFAQNLSLYLRLYQYVSFQGARYAQSFSVITGTGMVGPTGF